MQLLSVSEQRGNAEMYRRCGLVILREQGLLYMLVLQGQCCCRVVWGKGMGKGMESAVVFVQWRCTCGEASKAV